MKFSSCVMVGAAAGLASASPLHKRAGPSDGDILNYALTLEHLEATFYADGLKNYTEDDFTSAGFGGVFYTNLKSIASDEAAHVKFLTSALHAAGAEAVAACSYTFPLTDVKTFLAVANVLEGVGVSAYLGAAASIANKAYLTAAGSILTVESRHSAYLRSALGEAPAAQPFDDPLDFDEVYTVAAPFIASCPSSNPALPVKAFPSLTLVSTGPITTGSTVTLQIGPTYKSNGTVYAAFITVTGPVWTPVTPGSSGAYTVTIPMGVAGQSYVVLTSSNKAVSDDNILAGPAIVEISAPAGNSTTPGGKNSTSPSTTPGTPSPTSSTGPLSTGAAGHVMVQAGSVLLAAVVSASFLL